jgi:DNA-binding winged helix-turn-helix (wHTH) protein
MTFRFRNVRLDPATRQLWRDGARVPLPLKSFDCLTYLIEHRDRAVDRCGLGTRRSRRQVAGSPTRQAPPTA